MIKGKPANKCKAVQAREDEKRRAEERAKQAMMQSGKKAGRQRKKPTAADTRNAKRRKCADLVFSLAEVARKRWQGVSGAPVVFAIFSCAEELVSPLFGRKDFTPSWPNRKTVWAQCHGCLGNAFSTISPRGRSSKEGVITNPWSTALP